MLGMTSNLLKGHNNNKSSGLYYETNSYNYHTYILGDPQRSEDINHQTQNLSQILFLHIQVNVKHFVEAEIRKCLCNQS